jgi:hypothetical protein
MDHRYERAVCLLVVGWCHQSDRKELVSSPDIRTYEHTNMIMSRTDPFRAELAELAFSFVNVRSWTSSMPFRIAYVIKRLCPFGCRYARGVKYTSFCLELSAYLPSLPTTYNHVHTFLHPPVHRNCKMPVQMSPTVLALAMSHRAPSSLLLAPRSHHSDGNIWLKMTSLNLGPHINPSTEHLNLVIQLSMGRLNENLVDQLRGRSLCSRSDLRPDDKLLFSVLSNTQLSSFWGTCSVRRIPINSH